MRNFRIVAKKLNEKTRLKKFGRLGNFFFGHLGNFGRLGNFFFGHLGNFGRLGNFFQKKVRTLREFRTFREFF